tara:strand:+ start:631 stop:1248 length:618 start_codon:yes stop_codon:yes gene_type:complete
MNTSIKIIVLSDDEKQSISHRINDLGALPDHINPSDETIPKKITNYNGLVLGPMKINCLSNQNLQNLILDSVKSDMPILGIGHGMIALNLAFGGSFENVDEKHFSSNEKSNFHQIYITVGSKLTSIIGSGGFVKVNSNHQIGIKPASKASSLLESAYSVEDGFIEAVESPNHKWILGIQFNPERSNELPRQFNHIFHSFVDFCKK